jgi:acid phosphatase type 7
MRGVVLLICALAFGYAVGSVQNVRIALAGDVSRMAIVWITGEETLTSTVFYGTSTTSLNLQASSDSQTSYSSTAGWNHKVILTGLAPATTYYYQAGDKVDGFSAIFSFTTRHTSFVPHTVVAYGDMGVDNSNGTMTQLIRGSEAGAYDLVIHMGDISYANDHSAQFEETWTTWLTEMQPVMANVPYMVAPGNHESVCKALHCALQTSNFTTYKQKFRMPGPESGTDTNMFYSFDYYNIHFVAISSESDYPGAPPIESASPDHPPSPPSNESSSYFQINWLRKDLAKANAIVVFGHRPIYAQLLEQDGIPIGTSLQVQAFLEPILKEFEVDVYLTGHVHAYLRTYPTYNNTVTSYDYVDPPSTVHICAGGAGNVEGISTFTDFPSWYAAGNDKDFGFGAFVVDEESGILTWNYYLSKNGELADTFSITKTSHRR